MKVTVRRTPAELERSTAVTVFLSLSYEAALSERRKECFLVCRQSPPRRMPKLDSRCVSVSVSTERQLRFAPHVWASKTFPKPSRTPPKLKGMEGACSGLMKVDESIDDRGAARTSRRCCAFLLRLNWLAYCNYPSQFVSQWVVVLYGLRVRYSLGLLEYRLVDGAVQIRKKTRLGAYAHLIRALV